MKAMTVGRWNRHLLLLGTLVVITSCGVDDAEPEIIEPEVIVFQNVESSELHATDPDGRNPRVLHLGASSPTDPAWSSDGTRVAYVGGTEDSLYDSLYVVNLRGLKRRRISADVHGYFDWSPDAKRLVFVKSDADDRPWLWVVDEDGQNPRRLTRGTHPVWAPDDRIFFNRDGYHHPADSVGLWAIRADGTDERRLIEGDEVRFGPTVSKNGSRLAFIGYGGVFVANGDGSGRRQITSEPQSGDLKWSPDGDFLAFTDSDSLVIVDAQGKKPRRIAGPVNSGWGAAFSWSSDQRWIAIEGLSTGARTDIFVVDVRTGAQHRVTDAARSGAGSGDSFTSPRWISASRIRDWKRLQVATMTGSRAVLCSSEISGQWVATLTKDKAALGPRGVSPGEYLLTISDGYFRLERNVEGAGGNEQDLECADDQQLVISMGYDGAPGHDCEDTIGRYSWTHARNVVTFSEVTDPACPSRSFVLTELSWRPRG